MVVLQKEEKLRIVEKKIIRTVLEVKIIEENIYQAAMNFERIREELEGEDIISKIKKRRVKWLGHLWRVEEESMTHSML